MTGARFAVAEWGDPAGIPCFMIHGTPGGRISWWKDPTIYARFGIRRLTIDRPGYGESTPQPGRRVADLVPDLVEVADALGLDRFVVTGGSGGGPHALALAAMLPDRVIRCMASVSVAPYGVDGLDWLDGQTEGNVLEFQAALEGEEACRRLLTGLREELLTRLGAGRTDWMGDDYHLSEADQAMMVKHLERVRAQMVYSLVPGVDGWVDDDIAFTKPWGFDVTDIHVPIVLTYGRTDVLVPARTRRLAGGPHPGRGGLGRRGRGPHGRRQPGRARHGLARAARPASLTQRWGRVPTSRAPSAGSPSRTTRSPGRPGRGPSAGCRATSSRTPRARTAGA